MRAPPEPEASPGPAELRLRLPETLQVSDMKSNHSEDVRSRTLTVRVARSRQLTLGGTEVENRERREEPA